MAGVTEQEILDALAKVTEPGSGKDIVSAGLVKGLQIKDGHIGFSIEVDPKRGAELEPMRKLAEEVVYDIKGVISATVVLTAEKAQGAAPVPPATMPPGARRRADRPQKSARRTCCRVLNPSSRWPAARAASANRRRPSIWRWDWPRPGTRSA